MAASAAARARRIRLIACAILALLAAPLLGADGAIPSPEQFFGFRMGTARRLADWRRMVEYFRLVDRLSPRVTVQELGPTTDGRPFIVAVVSAPETMAALPRYQAIQRALVEQRGSPAETARAERDARVVVLVGAAVHANEIGSAQMMNDLVYELATSDADWVQRVLHESIVLLVPSQNPDGLQMVADWAAQNAGTPFEDAALPDLYQRYAGHDDNRDAYMLTQPESRYLARLMYRDWLPEVYLDQHQMGGSRARIFVPPYANPPNPNVDPLVWSEANMLGQAMAARLQEAGKPGVVWGEVYSGFWQGANSSNPWWHNMVGLLSEVASARLARPVFQARPGGRPQPGASDADDEDAAEHGDAIEPPPVDLQARMNYTQPWLGGRWTFADVVEYHHLAAVGLLEAAAAQRTQLVRAFARMNRRTIDRFAQGAPYAFIVPEAQHDRVAAAQLLRLVQAGGGRLQRATASFTADGERYPAGTVVIPLAQPFGRWIKDLLEPQRYPEVRWPSPSAPVDRPYDMTAWSLGLLMGVQAKQVERPFRATLSPLDADVATPHGTVRGTGDVYVIPHDTNTALTATARLLAQGAEVGWSRSGLRVRDRAFGPGALVVRGASAKLAARLAEELGVDVEASPTPPDVATIPLRLPRVAVYEPWGGTTDAGWTRYVLDRHELPYTRVRPQDVRGDGFAAGYDVVVLPEATDQVLLRGLPSPARPEHKGGLGEEGVIRLRAFVEQGGTIVALGATAQFLVDRFGLPLDNVVSDVPQDGYFCPGSILKLEVDPTHPIAFGLPERVSAMVVGNAAYVPTARAGNAVTTVARFPEEPLLQSGWIVGDTALRGAGAVLDVRVGRGHVVLITFRAQHRGQTLGTFKLLLNAIYYGAALAPAPALLPTQQQD